MLVLFPIPGYLAKKIQDVQIERMKKVRSFSISEDPNDRAHEIDGCSGAKCDREYVSTLCIDTMPRLIETCV